jgi:hypothetical protein
MENNLKKAQMHHIALKRMKYSVITILILMVNTVGFTQNIEISEEQSMRTDYTYEIIGQLDGQVLLFKEESNEFILQAFNDKMKVTKEKKLAFKQSYMKYIGTTTSRKDFTLLFSFRKRGDTFVKAHKYNSKFELIDSTTIETYERRAFAPEFAMEISQNRRYALMYNVEKDKYLETLLFDTKTMKLVWEQTFMPDDFYFKRDFMDFLVDNKGGGHLIISHDNQKSKMETNRLEFISFDVSMETPKNYILSLSDKIWYDILFDYDNRHQKIVAGGLVSNDFQTKAIGYFYLNISPKNESDQVLKYHKFNQKFVQDVLGKEKPRKREGFAEVDVQEIVLRSDGGILLIAERNRIYVRQSGNVNSAYAGRNISGNQTDYYYDDVLVFSIHPTGDLHWKEILYKKQYSQDDNAMYSSYFLLKTRSSLRFLYNDEISQENPVNEYILTGSGEPDRKNIMNTQGVKLMLVLKKSMQVSANEIVIPSERRRQFKLVKLKY